MIKIIWKFLRIIDTHDLETLAENLRCMCILTSSHLEFIIQFIGSISSILPLAIHIISIIEDLIK